MARLSRHLTQRYLDRPDGEFDLHGYTRAEALPELERFLGQAESLRWSRVRIITGQGRNSPDGEPVLRNWLEDYLDRNGYNYRRAPHGQGGHGAIDVRLR